MIKNERQYNTTRKQLELMSAALASLKVQQASEDLDDVLFRQIQRDALHGQVMDLRAEIKEYDDLRAGKLATLALDSIDALSNGLIAARIASGMTQKGLAEQLGIKEQMIQRYEASDYSSASFSRLKEIAQALNVGVREEIFLPAAGASIRRLFQRLQEAGIDRHLMMNRILPLHLLSEIESPSEEVRSADADLAVRAASSVERVFGITPTEIFGTEPLSLQSQAVATARFKVMTAANEERLSAYSVYANYLAQVVLQASVGLGQIPLPSSAKECRDAIRDTYGEIRYETALHFVWDLGIPVLPLSDPGAFHGALWRVEGRNVIVLKQRTDSPSRWLINLLHELRHAAQSPNLPELTVIEEAETLQDRIGSEIEEDAVWFAIDVALDGRAEDLAAECTRRSRGRAERLKLVVPQVALEAAVDVGVLADYMAFRLAHDGTVDWWGAATNLQPKGTDPLQEATGIFWDRTDLGTLSRFDQELLVRALAEA